MAALKAKTIAFIWPPVGARPQATALSAGFASESHKRLHGASGIIEVGEAVQTQRPNVLPPPPATKSCNYPPTEHRARRPPARAGHEETEREGRGAAETD